MSSESEAIFICITIPLLMLYHSGTCSSLPGGDSVGAEVAAAATAAIL
jgi:hypothetical protein